MQPLLKLMRPAPLIPCHCTLVGVGLPSLTAAGLPALTLAVKSVFAPASLLDSLPILVIVGTKFTVNVATLVVALRLAALLKTARYWVLFSPAAAPVIVSVVVVTPLYTPPSL